MINNIEQLTHIIADGDTIKALFNYLLSKFAIYVYYVDDLQELNPIIKEFNSLYTFNIDNKLCINFEELQKFCTCLFIFNIDNCFNDRNKTIYLFNGKQYTWIELLESYFDYFDRDILLKYFEMNRNKKFNDLYLDLNDQYIQFNWNSENSINYIDYSFDIF